VPPTTDVEAEAGGSTDVAPRARTVYFKPEDLTAANLNRQDVVIHLHRSVSRPAFQIVPVGDEVSRAVSRADDPLYRAQPVGASRDRRTSVDHDAILYPR
jgi:hypothetical protein